MIENDFFTIFVFPFKYESGDEKDISPVNIAKKLCKEGWTVQEYKIESVENYNEFYYFHPFVRQAIFNKKGNTGMEYLVRNDYKYLEVEYIYDDKNGKEKGKKKKISIATDIKSIDLHLFDNQIGLLTMTTEKCADDNETTFSDLLRYNDIARRVYSPFIVAGEDNTSFLKSESQLLPSRITAFNRNDDKQNISECFKSIPLSKEDDSDIIYLSGIIKKFLSPFDLKEKKEKQKDKIYYTPFTDDRMFIVSYYANEKLSNVLKKRCCDRYDYENSKDWYRFIFVDGNYPNIANPNMMRELIQKHTYSRWIEEGSLFGMSRYSLVMAGDNGTFCKDVLKQHMKSIYYQIALIVLFQRAMLLKFSDDIFYITNGIEHKTLDELQNNTSKLHGDFIRFINKYWFIKVTPQEQGIEMYSQWMGLLNIDKLYQEIEKEIVELARYVDSKVELGIMTAESKRNEIESERNSRIELITILGVPFAVIGIVIGLWQIYADVIDKFKPLSWMHTRLDKFEVLDSFIILFITAVFAGISAYILIKRTLRKKFNP